MQSVDAACFPNINVNDSKSCFAHVIVKESIFRNVYISIKEGDKQKELINDGVRLTFRPKKPK